LHRSSVISVLSVAKIESITQVARTTSISDSPWFWMMVYSAVPLVGLALLNHKYGERQARLERQYQGHMTAAEKKSAQFAGGDASADDSAAQTDSPTAPRNYSSAEDTIIPLAPLTLIFLAIACFAAVMLAREQRRLARERDAGPILDGNASP
jgi:hypothetical protein